MDRASEAINEGPYGGRCNLTFCPIGAVGAEGHLCRCVPNGTPMTIALCRHQLRPYGLVPRSGPLQLVPRAVEMPQGEASDVWGQLVPVDMKPHRGGSQAKLGPYGSRPRSGFPYGPIGGGETQRKYGIASTASPPPSSLGTLPIGEGGPAIHPGPIWGLAFPPVSPFPYGYRP